jgi:hypothetical protein
MTRSTLKTAASIAWPRALIFALVAASHFLFGCYTCKQADRGAPAPLENQALGDPCTDATSCNGSTQGPPQLPVVCLQVHPGESSRATHACTVDCSSGQACPTGFACLAIPLQQSAADGGALPTQACVPTCGTDDDCRKGTRAGVCQLDSASQQKVCRPFRCFEGSGGTAKDALCPSGFHCEDQSGGCCPPGAMCEPSLQGWCRKG